MDTSPVEVTVQLYGWAPGESEVGLSIPDTSDLGRLLEAASPAEVPFLFARLRRHLVAELADAFAELEAPRQPAPAGG